MLEFRSRFDEKPGFKMVDLERYLSKYATSYLLVRHEPRSNNPHYHAWFSTEYADSTVRLMLTKHMPYLKGNEGHSVQACDPLRRDEYRQYLFNRKEGNLATFVKELAVPDWERFRDLANECTIEYIKSKKVFSKNDCIEHILCMQHNNWESEGDVFDVIMKLSRERKTVFSINAIRDIIIAVGYHDGTQALRATVKDAVLKVFQIKF